MNNFSILKRGIILGGKPKEGSNGKRKKVKKKRVCRPEYRSTIQKKKDKFEMRKPIGLITLVIL